MPRIPRHARHGRQSLRWRTARGYGWRWRPAMVGAGSCPGQRGGRPVPPAASGSGTTPAVVPFVDGGSPCDTWRQGLPCAGSSAQQRLAGALWVAWRPRSLPAVLGFVSVPELGRNSGGKSCVEEDPADQERGAVKGGDSDGHCQRGVGGLRCGVIKGRAGLVVGVVDVDVGVG